MLEAEAPIDVPWGRETTFLVTRPVRQATQLADELVQQGFHALPFPCQEIIGLDTSLLDTAWLELANYDWVAFVSPNAIHQAFLHWQPAIQQFHQWPLHLNVMVLGPGSAHALHHYVPQAKIVMPLDSQQLETESLLTQLPRSLQGQRVLLIKGQGGRTLLHDALKARGAHITTLVCYQQRCPTLSTEQESLLLQLQTQHTVLSMGKLQHSAAVWIVMSSQACENLVQMLSHSPCLNWAYQQPLITMHPNIVQKAHQLGFQQIYQTLHGHSQMATAISYKKICQII